MSHQDGSAGRPQRIADVARHAGVSPATVSRVLNDSGYVAADKRQRVEEAIRALGWEPNALARSLRQRATRTIGLIIPDIVNPFHAEAARGIEDAGSRHGYNLILCHSDESVQKEAGYLQVLRAKQIDGLVVAPTGQNRRYLRSLLEAGVAIVQLDRRTEDELDAVLVDNVRGSFDAISYLLGLGHRRVAVITGPAGVTTGRERLEGYQQALAQAGLPVDPRYICYGDFRAGSGHELAAGLLRLGPDERPTALFVANNAMGTGALLAVRELGLRIPEDLSLIVWDDLEWASLVTPPITTVFQPAYDLGATAFDLLLRRMRGEGRGPGGATLRLQPRLVVRGSCGPPHPATGS